MLETLGFFFGKDLISILLYYIICGDYWFMIAIKCWQGTYVEGIKEEVVLSPAHALSLIASGEGVFPVLFF